MTVFSPLTASAPHHRLCRTCVAGAMTLLAVVAGGCLAGCGSSADTGSGDRVTDSPENGERRLQYTYFVTELEPCILALHFPVAPEPNLEDFLSQPPELAWSPWTALRSSASPWEKAHIRDICPKDPTEPY